MQRYWYAIESSPNGSYAWWGSNGCVVRRFESKRKRDAWINAEPSWATLFMGIRVQFRSREYIRDKAVHRNIPISEATVGI